MYFRSGILLLLLLLLLVLVLIWSYLRLQWLLTFLWLV